MLDLRRLLEDADESSRRLASRGEDIDLSALALISEKRKAAINRRDGLRHEQKQISNNFKGPDITADERDELRVTSKALSARISGLQEEIGVHEKEIEDFLLNVPNIPHDSVPIGTDENDNPVIRKVGNPVEHEFEPSDHVEIGERLKIIDLEAASRISGSRQVVYMGAGARLERALAGFMLDMHVEDHGYMEVMPPYMVKPECMLGTGQLPKFKEDAYEATDGLFLIPTAEVPVTNMHRGEMLSADTLPIRYVAYSSCFRREAGSYGRDVRGITRLHQFQKVELVKFTTSETSYDELEGLVHDAEVVLQRLELPYRVIELCTGDLGFGAAKCYDIEVWLPGHGEYREISSCSCYEDFQARRASIRYRPAPGEKPRYVHTLNGSALAIGRTIIAILENYQNPDGSVTVPGTLRPYMNGMEVLGNQ